MDCRSRQKKLWIFWGAALMYLVGEPMECPYLLGRTISWGARGQNEISLCFLSSGREFGDRIKYITDLRAAVKIGFHR